MYPEKEKVLTAAQRAEIEKRNPEGSAIRGKWGDPEFLASVRASAKRFALNENETRAMELRWAPR